MKTTHSRQVSLPLILHLVNLVALLVMGVIVLVAAVLSVRSLALLLPILGLIVVYWWFRANPNIVAVYFGISMGLLVWIITCENIVTIDNLVGSQITQRLSLGSGLSDYVDVNLKTQRKYYFQPCCNDPLSWSYRPGSKYRLTYDCATCNEPYEVVVDETGFLNRPLGLMTSHDQIDMFLSGDSVFQGLGVPSVVEFLRDQIPVKMWNLSIAGYGPRQKVSALIAYALPKQPKWLVVDFYARNDVRDSLRTNKCQETGDFRCRFNPSAYRIGRDAKTNIFEIFAYYSSQNFTLATTRYLLDTLKSTIRTWFPNERLRYKSGMEEENDKDSPNTNMNLHHPRVDFIRRVEKSGIHHEKLLEWAIAGMPQVHREYERLAAKVKEMGSKPAVILLYNPSPYELYRDILTDLNAEYDQVAEFQKETQKAFAEEHGWVFLDLTGPLRSAIQTSQMWIYGRYDPHHWSYQGTELVASVLRAELLKIIE